MRFENAGMAHSNGGDRIGALELWIRKRLSEWVRGRGSKKQELLCAWEQGFRGAIEDFERALYGLD